MTFPAPAPEPTQDGPTRPPEADDTPPAPRGYLAIATRYRGDITAGLIPACHWVKLAVARQDRDLARAAADPTWPYVWSPAEAAAVCAFVERLPHVEGLWATPTIVLEPAQVFLLTCLFGWRRRADPRLRRFRTLYWELGRKGAKSTLMAAIGLYHLVCEGEPGPNVICGATTYSQARIVWKLAHQMVVRSPWLRRKGIRPMATAICLMADGQNAIGEMRAINAKASTQDGLNPSCIVLDESHAQTFELHDVLKSAQGARANPLLLCPTTAGYDQLSIGYALRTTLCKILEGSLEADHFFGLIYTLDEGDDWRDETTWIKANPMIGITPRLSEMREYCLDAQQTPGIEGEFRVKRCSQWANASAAWLSLAHWDACAEPGLSIDAFAGCECWIGGDLAQLDDLAALAYLFHRDDLLYAFVRCYLPAGVVQERARAVPAYREWAARGDLILTDGTMINYPRIEADIREACTRFTVKDICFDKYQSSNLVGNLFNVGIPARTEHKSAAVVTPAARELETRIKHRRFRHDGNACLRWQAGNVVVSRRIDDSILPKKETAMSPNKIDAIDALIQAIGGYLRAAAVTPDYAITVIG